MEKEIDDVNAEKESKGVRNRGKKRGKIRERREICSKKD